MTQMTESRPLRILVVEDELLIRWSIAETLAHAGHTVAEADSGEAAISELSHAPAVDAVVLDYRLPDSNDLGLLRRIRQMAPDSHVILMTAYGTPEVMRGAYDLGVYAVLNKPFDMVDLEAKLRTACSASTS